MSRKQTTWAEEQLEQLYQRYASRLVQLACRATGDQQLAQDAVQECFLLLLFKRDELYSHPNIGGWLFKTTDNLARRAAVLARRDAELTPQHTAPEPSCSLEQLLPQQLSTEDRQLLLLYYEHKLPAAEIAAALHISYGSCRNSLQRARRRCRELMKEQGE